MSHAGRTRAVVVGAGLMGRWHAHALAQAGVEVVAVVDPDEGRGAPLARAHGARWVRTLDGLPRGSADAAHLCTPSGTREELVEAALGAGFHVLVEKPFASSAEVTRRLLTSAEAHGLHACPVHQFPFQDGFRRVLGALGTLGRIRHVDVVVCSAGSDGRDASGRDEIALEIVPHALSLLARLLPEPVDEPAWRVDHPEAGELRATTVVGGATLSILVSMAGRPTRNTLRVVADRGTAHADLFHGFAVIEPGDVSRARKLARPFTLSATTLAAAATNLAGRALTRRPAYPGLRELIEAFHGSVRTGSPPPIAATETLRVARAWDAIRRSAGAPDPA